MGFSDTGEKREAKWSVGGQILCPPNLRLRLTSSLAPDNVLPGWITSIFRDGFLTLGFSVVESRILPLATLLPIKLIGYVLSVRLRFYQTNF